MKKTMMMIMMLMALTLLGACAGGYLPEDPHKVNENLKPPILVPADQTRFTAGQLVTILPDAANVSANGFVAYTINTMTQYGTYPDDRPRCDGFFTKTYTTPFTVYDSSKIYAVYCYDETTMTTESKATYIKN